MNTDMASALFDALRALARVGGGVRVNHARGILVEGHFRATRTAMRFCLAGIFDGAEQRVSARFSSSGADPHIDQRSPLAEPRGLALRIGNNAALTLVGHSIEGFPAADPERFLAMLIAMNANRPVNVGATTGRDDCPISARFEALRQQPASSFTTLDYHMLHPYRLIAADGHVRVGRLSIRAPRSEAGTTTRDGPDCLDKRLRSELSKGPVVLALQFTPVTGGVDPTDLSVAWDPLLPSVTLGHLWLERVALRQGVQRRLVFDPALLPEGIAFAGDPMLYVRLRAYRLAALQRRR
ncbi:catalase [Stenotrophomonas sp. Iso1]|uniref:catalase n=1 Tax=Stenotrophomonas sp. Iso1 TaxID=2977283 RepID=UPI0022B7855B|nr:catalase [Stenotrophomonas sp. Iso1]